jgi:hypothetical protein
MIIINTILFCSIIGLILNFILYIKNSKQSKSYSIKFIKDIKVSSNKWIIRYSIIILISLIIKFIIYLKLPL